MPDITINIQGLPELLARMDKLPKEVQEEVEGEIFDSVIRINGIQRRRAPKDQGGLVRGVGYEKRRGDKTSHFELFSNSEESGYMEFGTKHRVRVPAELQQIAAQMQGPGITSKLKAKQSIYAWAKRKGIEKRAWYAIFKAIMTIGVNPHPFFYQPFFDERDKLLNRIRVIVGRYSSNGVAVIMPGDFNRNTNIRTI